MIERDDGLREGATHDILFKLHVEDRDGRTPDQAEAGSRVEEDIDSTPMRYLRGRLVRSGGPGRRANRDPRHERAGTSRFIDFVARSSSCAGGGTMGNLPGARGILGGRPAVRSQRCSHHDLDARSGTGPTEMQMPISAPQPQPVSPTTTPFYGTLDILAQEDDGPLDGMTLDRAIDTTLERSLDLRSKFYEIPMARADTLQANLRSNPIFYQDGQLLQYRAQPHSAGRPPGARQFDTNITYPLDVSHKRQARTIVAAPRRADPRGPIPGCGPATGSTTSTAPTSRPGGAPNRPLCQVERRRAEKLTALTEELHEKGQISQADLNLVKIKLRIARLGLSRRRGRIPQGQAGSGIAHEPPDDEARSMELRGTISDAAPPPPPLDELSRTALETRPDVVSVRLGVQRAYADVRLAKANAYSDIYVLWQPYTFQDNSPYGLKSQYSWALGVTVPLPIYNRNQGGIQRAKLNVDQSQVQLTDLERQVRIDVEKAVQEYEVTQRLVADLRSDVIPEARQVKDAAFRMWTGGETSLIAYLLAQLDYNDVVKRYIDTAIRHRQSMLSLNTAVGRRIIALIGAVTEDSGRRRWDVESPATGGHTWRLASRACSSPRSPTSWPATVSSPRPSVPRLLHLAAGQAGTSGFSSQSIAVPQNQGPLLNPDGTINNQALAPTGTLSKREFKNERFVARYVGTYTVGAGRTSDESIQTFITAAGSANTMRHSDIQLLLVTPKDPSLPIGGVSTIFDRNLNTNTVLGFDVAAAQSPLFINRLGLPSFLPTVSLDVNLSAGTYDEAYAVGTMSIRYTPNAKHTPGVISQGKAVVTIHAQIYSARVGFILRNANIDP